MRRSKLLLRRLPFPAILAFRYLRSTRRDAFASFLSLAALSGIGLGVAALIVCLAVISGFQNALRTELLARTPQIEVELPMGSELTGAGGAERAREAVRRVAGVRSVQVLVRGNGWLSEGGKALPVELVGFEARVPRFFPGAAGKPAGFYVSAGLAARWALEPGRRVNLVSPRPTLTPFGPQPRLRTLPVTGTFETGRAQEEKERVALPRGLAESLLGRDDLRLEVETADLDTALAVAGRLGTVLPKGSVVRTWQDLNRPLLFALRLEKLMMFVAVSLIVLVAVLALVANLALIISSKRPEIGMLGAMGAAPAALRRAFVLLGGLVAGTGLLLGVALGVGTSWFLDRKHLIPVPGRVYFLDYVPFRVELPDLLFVILVTAFLALSASAYAAQKAAALDPVEALQR